MPGLSSSSADARSAAHTRLIEEVSAHSRTEPTLVEQIKTLRADIATLIDLLAEQQTTINGLVLGRDAVIEYRRLFPPGST